MKTGIRDPHGRRRSIRRWAFRALVVKTGMVLVVQAGASVGTLPSPAATFDNVAHPAMTAVSEVRAILERRGLPVDAAQSFRDTALALARVADPQAQLLSDQELSDREASANGELWGIGLQLTRSNLQTRVREVLAGSPAADAGLLPGARITAVGGRPTDVMHIAEITALLRNPTNKVVTLTLDSGADQTEDKIVEPRRLAYPPVEEAHLLPTGLGYLRINGLYGDAGTEIQRIISDWKSSEMVGLVLDLRGADGRDLDAVVAVASMLTSPGAELFRVQSADHPDGVAYEAVSAPRLKIPLMLLVDEATSGAAEALAGVLSASTKGAMLIGRMTAGDPMTREPVALSNGQHLYITNRKLVNADGEVIASEDGVAPDIRVAPHSEFSDYAEPERSMLTDRREKTDNEVAISELRAWIRGDAPLTRAVDLLLGLKSLNLLQHFDGDNHRR